MSTLPSRYEYRVWADALEDVAARIRSLSDPHGTRHSAETYLVSVAADDVNPKVRNGLLDIKVLMARRDGCEQWEPRLKAEFPVDSALLRLELFPLLGLDTPPLDRDRYTLTQLVEEVVQPHPDLAAAEVHKHRHAFTVNGCIAELAEVTIVDTQMQTAAVESADLHALAEARRLAGLDAYENVNYPRVIKKTLGWPG